MLFVSLFPPVLLRRKERKGSLVELRVQLPLSVSTVSKRFVEEEHFLSLRRIELELADGQRHTERQRRVREQFDQVEETRLAQHHVDRRMFGENGQEIRIVGQILNSSEETSPAKKNTFFPLRSDDRQD